MAKMTFGKLRPTYKLGQKHTVVLEGTFADKVNVKFEDPTHKYVWTIHTAQPVTCTGGKKFVQIEVTPELKTKEGHGHHRASDVNGNLTVTVTDPTSPNDPVSTNHIAIME